MRNHRLLAGRLVDVVAVGFVVAQLVELLATRSEVADLAVVVLMVLGPSALLLRHRVPLPAVVLSLGAFAALIELVPSSLSSTFLAFLFAVGVSGSLSRVPAVAGLLGGWAVCFEGAWLDRYGAGLADFAMSAALLAGLWACGRFVAQAARQARLTASRAEAAELARREAAEQAVRAERDRMTRELHDVVAHGLTVLVVQTVAARQDLADGAPVEAVDRRLRATEEVARESLLELRTLLGILGTREAGLTATGIEGVRALVARLSAPGFTVELEVTGDLDGLGHGVDLAVYRVVQEGLTNAVKHGDGQGAVVRVEHAAGCVRVEVVNTLAAAGSAAAPGSGRGLPGLRDRVAQHGGSLSAVAGDGRFTLTCELPVHEAVAPVVP